MKPIKLTMSAFISYADIQVVDFSALGENGIYLITGDTGAGKTTIFDAISFALYGKASGSARDNYIMLRSDYAEERTKTYVELEFLSGSDCYKIKRGITKCGQTVEFTLPDGTSISGANAVKTKIIDIVGLEQDQFAQIVMIAQNDFLRFLQSGTDERVKILRRIFNTEQYRQFQIRMNEMKKQKERELDFLLHDFNRYDVDVYRREEYFSQWQSEIETGNTQLQKADEELERLDKQKQKFAIELVGAEELSEKFNALQKCQNELNEHNECTEENENAKVQAARAEIALYKVKPVFTEMQRAEKDYSDAQTKHTEAEEKKSAAILEVEEVEKMLSALPPLDEAQSVYEDLLEEWKSASSDLTEIIALQKNNNEINEKMTELEIAQVELEELNTAYIEAERHYHELEESFLRNQAGILAQSLTTGEPCPVCGAVEHPHPAELSDTVDDAGRKRAKTTAESAQSKREKKALYCSKLNAEVETLVTRLKNDSLKFIGDCAVEELGQKIDVLLAKATEHENMLMIRKDNDKKELDKLSLLWTSTEKRKIDADSLLNTAIALTKERASVVQELRHIYEDAVDTFRDILNEHGFFDVTEYANSLLTNTELNALKKRITDYEKNGEILLRDFTRLTEETTGKEEPDIETLRSNAEAATNEAKESQNLRDEIKQRLDRTKSALKELQQVAAKFEQAEKQYAAVKQLSDTANGRFDFETYVQTVFFESVLHAANMRLSVMSQNQFDLRRKADSSDARKRSGLDIEVYDTSTGKARPADSLSGGESFMASLSLALGLSDIVQQNAGGITLDAMFIDEGFGSLDSDVLELSIRTLSEMAGANRIVGIISHVSELRERIDRQIKVEKSTNGSKIVMSV